MDKDTHDRAQAIQRRTREARKNLVRNLRRGKKERKEEKAGQWRAPMNEEAAKARERTLTPWC